MALQPRGLSLEEFNGAVGCDDRQGSDECSYGPEEWDAELEVTEHREAFTAHAGNAFPVPGSLLSRSIKSSSRDSDARAASRAAKEKFSFCR